MSRQYNQFTLENSPSKQAGAIALIVTLVLLLLATMGTLYVTRSSVIDQRISANVVRAKAAFEAADAGLNFALSFMDVDARDLGGVSGTDDRTEMLTALGISDDMDDATGLEFDDCDNPPKDEICDAAEAAAAAAATPKKYGFSLQAIWDAANSEYDWSLPSTLPNDAGACDSAVNSNNVRICLSLRMSDGIGLVDVVATGYSDDRLGVKQIEQQARRVNPIIPDPPTHPLISYGAVNASGSMQIVNVFSNATVWTGENVVSLGNPGNPNAGTLIHPNPDGATTTIDGNGDLIPYHNGSNLLDYTQSNPYTASDLAEVSKGQALGVDIIDNSAALRCDKNADPYCFFNNFIVGPASFAKDQADYITTDDGLVDPDGIFAVAGSHIWADARDSNGAMIDFSIKNGTYGSVADPIFLVIDGNFDPAGSPTIYGLVYVRGDLPSGGCGGGMIIGTLIVEGGGGVSGSGGCDIIYDPNILGRAGRPIGRWAVVPIAGTWKDWQ